MLGHARIYPWKICIPPDRYVKIYVYSLYFVGFKNEFKGKGYTFSFIEECIKDAKENNMQAIVLS
jgi:hypothetical protein